MPNWIPARAEHWALLQAFRCMPPLTPRYGDRTKRQVREHWANQLERNIHKIHKLPVRPPEHLLIALNVTPLRINALAWFEMKIKAGEPDAVYVQIGALAVHAQMQRNHLGAEGLELIKQTAAEWARAKSSRINLMRLEADVHAKNNPCISLISGAGWTALGKARSDGYQPWGAVYRVGA
ncbi:hypothetical protein SCMU_18300 [Sinomonas cyclohexanicum]|uniref:Uncharacterized protein n=1 Tax=Sinomonas cyclohexanicum TaxID=322009 RepID=A0ABM7PUR2_SINCY|nr:hypothetical protein [Corynebacterium cyclohexanicum]BCT75988.1 hypothetical protein SCMU_18300 [Corynebacterium cyclohexanicum]